MRIAALLLLLSLLLSLTACGENAKRQEAVDAYSKAAHWQCGRRCLQCDGG